MFQVTQQTLLNHPDLSFLCGTGEDPGTGLALNGGGCFLTDSESMVRVVIVVYNLLDYNSD